MKQFLKEKIKLIKSNNKKLSILAGVIGNIKIIKVKVVSFNEKDALIHKYANFF